MASTRPTGSHRCWRADLALAGITLIWGATFVLVKQALQDVSTLLFLALRFSLASLALGLVFRPLSSKFSDPATLLRGGVLAGLCLFGGYVFQTFGLHYTTPSKSAFITGLSVVMVPLLGGAVRKTWPQVSEGLGVALATLGMGLMTLEGETLTIGRGDLLTLACAFAFAVHIVVVGHYAPQVSFAALTLVQIATAALLASGSFWWAEPAVIRWRPGVVIALVVTGLLATALAFSVQAWAQQHTTATRTALIFALEPVFAWATSFVLTGELLSARATLGAVAILAGILCAELKPVQPRRHPSV